MAGCLTPVLPIQALSPGQGRNDIHGVDGDADGGRSQWAEVKFSIYTLIGVFLSILFLCPVF